jgi:hypothetical protein
MSYHKYAKAFAHCTGGAHPPPAPTPCHYRPHYNVTYFLFLSSIIYPDAICMQERNNNVKFPKFSLLTIADPPNFRKARFDPPPIEFSRKIPDFLIIADLPPQIPISPHPTPPPPTQSSFLEKSSLQWIKQEESLRLFLNMHLKTRVYGIFLCPCYCENNYSYF